MRRVILCLLGAGACTPNAAGLGTSSDGAPASSGPDSTSSTTSSEPSTGPDGDATGATTTSPTTTSPTTTDETTTVASCGDGIVERNEACDDENADELDGCTSTCELGPLGLVFGDLVETPEPFGGWLEETTFATTSDCGPNEVLVGLRGWFGYYSQYFVLTQVWGVCAPLQLTNTVPATIGFGASYELETHGNYPGTESFDFVCPDGSVATGLYGKAGLYTDLLGVTCQSLSLSPGLDTVELGSPLLLGPIGAPVSVESSLDCSNDRVAAGFRIEGDEYAARFHLRCRSLDVQWQ